MATTDDRDRTVDLNRTADMGGVPPCPPDAPDFPGFAVVQKIGEGGFGAVFLARDEKLCRQVALKVLAPAPAMREGERERLLREARALARIRHPNVLAVHAVLEHGGRIGLATELIDGETLDRIVEERGPLGAGEAAQIGAEVCRALAAVHGGGLVHRDVKSGNIMREKGGRIVLMDFGLGRSLGEALPGEEQRAVVGSPFFMSPEQATGKDADARSDLYSLGVVLYHLASGAYPVRRSTILDVLAAIREGSLTPLRDVRPDIPDSFARGVTKALATDPADRFQSAGEMEDALLACMGATAGGAPARRGSARPLRARILLAGGAAALALAVALLLGLFSSRTFHVEASLWKESGGERVRLLDGERVRVGDELSLEFEGDRDLYVYVLNEDEGGRRFLLFPIAGGSKGNPLAGDARHRLPGSVRGLERNWQIDSAGGKEAVFVVASIDPVPPLEALVPRGAVPAEVAVGYPETGDLAMRDVLRGMGRTTVAGPAEPAASPASASIASLVERLRDAREEAKDLWIRKIDLINP